MTFADKIIEFNSELEYTGSLPSRFRVLNPFKSNPETMEVVKQFYKKYYSDTNNRRFIIGINPGRHGAGVTGIPFTDTKRLDSFCCIQMLSDRTHEISSVFIYDMISSYGGVEKFYKEFYINSPFPLAILRETTGSKWINANYYDDKELFKSVRGYMIESLKSQIAMGLDTSRVFVLGRKNADFILLLNKEAKLFDEIVVLEHPRFIQQYKSKDKERYIEKYLHAFKE
ncbi:MAG TPA: SMUG2 DNA glycosylase family protein [Bacteroidaceae bacterium]|nr:SMUG2 DNA glycosylase family protein [Bacteroidaceae bacterium]